MRHAALAVLLGIALVAGHPATAASAEPRMSVTYHAPLISIDATEATVAEILREVGRAVGFSIVEAGSSDARLSVSIHEASLPETLQRLLRSENHVLLYRDGTQTIDTVMVLGARVARAPAPFNQPDHAVNRPEGPDPGRTNQSVEIAATPATPVSRARAQRSSEVADATDLLLRHAGSGVPALQPPSPSGGTPETSSSVIAGDATAADPGTTLATTTRLARQNLTKLVEALSAATASMRSSNRR